jgi:hypothetical protein
LGNGGDSISGLARDAGEDVIPDGSLVLLVGARAGSMDGEDADMASAIRPQMARARRRGATDGSEPSSILYIPRVSFSCREDSFSSFAR